MINIPKVKVGIVAVSRDCFPESLSVGRREALVKAYHKAFDAEDIMCISWQFRAGDFRDASGKAL